MIIARILLAIFAVIGVYLTAVILLPFVLWFEWHYNHQTFEDPPKPQTYITQPKSGQCYAQYDAQGKYHSDPQIIKCR